MAKAKEKKNYVVISADGTYTVRMLTPGTDGRAHSMVFSLPQVRQVVDADGNTKLVRITRKQMVSEALKEMAIYYK